MVNINYITITFGFFLMKLHDRFNPYAPTLVTRTRPPTFSLPEKALLITSFSTQLHPNILIFLYSSPPSIEYIGASLLQQSQPTSWLVTSSMAVSFPAIFLMAMTFASRDIALPTTGVPHSAISSLSLSKSLLECPGYYIGIFAICRKWFFFFYLRLYHRVNSSVHITSNINNINIEVFGKAYHLVYPFLEICKASCKRNMTMNGVYSYPFLLAIIYGFCQLTAFSVCIETKS